MPAKTTEMPVGFRITYAPHLLDRAFRKWAREKFPALGEIDVESQAYANLNLEADLWQWYLAVDFAAYLIKSKMKR